MRRYQQKPLKNKGVSRVAPRVCRQKRGKRRFWPRSGVISPRKKESGKKIKALFKRVSTAFGHVILRFFIPTTERDLKTLFFIKIKKKKYISK